MSADQHLRRIEDLYTSNLKELGATSRAVGWNTPESQRLRFAKLAALVNHETGPFSLNDYGCGYGAILAFLVDELGCEVSGYHGYDISASMLEEARSALARFDDIVHLHCAADVSVEADYSFVSGTFNVRFDASTEEWESFIESRLAQLDAHSRRGFAFNLLTSHVDWQEPHLYYGDPGYWFDLCVRRFSRHVVLLHDYPLWEWTLIVRK